MNRGRDDRVTATWLLGVLALVIVLVVLLVAIT